MITDEPTPEQTNVQPSTYASAVSMTNSHNQPVSIENFLRDLNLGTPELLKGTFKLHTTSQGKLVAHTKDTCMPDDGTDRPGFTQHGPGNECSAILQVVTVLVMLVISTKKDLDRDFTQTRTSTGTQKDKYQQTCFCFY